MSFSPRRPLAFSLTRCSSALTACLALLAASAPRSQAAALLWDADGNSSNGLGGTGTWDTANPRWFNGTMDTVWPAAASATDRTAVFQGTPGVVSLGEPITANGLNFAVTGFTVDNGGTPANTLTLAGTAPTVTVNQPAARATISAVVSGAAGLTKDGRGALYLTNTANNYTGTMSINAGTVVPSVGSGTSLSASLGADTSAVLVTSTNTRGVAGGALVLSGNEAGLTFDRPLTLTGGGPNNDGYALTNSGNVTLTKAVSSPATGAVSTRLYSAFGQLSIGDLAVNGTAGSTVTTIGGAGNAAITGVLSGSGTLEKIGTVSGNQSGTLILNPSSATGFTGNLRITSGSVRISSPAAVGGSISGTGTASPFDLNGGTLEVRTDATGSFGSFYDDLGGTVFVDHAIGSTALNNNVTFDTYFYDDTRDVTFNGRNGTNVVFNAVTTHTTTSSSSTITNSLNGLLTIKGDYNGVLSFAGNGDSVITGSLIAAGTATLVKTGTGTLTVQGTSSSFGGIIAVTGGGTLAVNSLGALNNTAGTTLQIASTSTSTTSAGTFQFLGAAGTGDGGTLVKSINLAGARLGSDSAILADQAGTAPTALIITGPITSGAASKTLTLGGASKLDNEITGAIPDNSGTNLTSVLKSGAGTWVLSGNNSYTGSTTVAAGRLKLKANLAASSVINDSSMINFGTSGQSAGGTLEFIGLPNVSTTETLGVLNTLGGAGKVVVTPGSGGTANLTFASINPIFNATNTVASTSSTTITVPTTGLFAGQGIYGAGVTGGSAISSISSGTALVATQTQVSLPIGTQLTFTRPTGTSLNFAPAAGGSVTITTLPTSGLVGGYAYFNGTDFAYAPTASNASLRAPVYDTDPGFVTAGATLTAGSNNVMTADAAADTGTVTSLKISGSRTLTLNAAQSLTVSAGDFTAGGILATGGSSTITGGTGITAGLQGDLVFRVDGKTDQLTLSTPILASTTGGLTKTGDGTLVLTAANNQSGPTNILEGTVQLSGTGRLSAGSVALNIRQDGALDLNGVATGTSIGNFSGSGTVTNNGSVDAVLTIGNTAGAGTFSGPLTDGPTNKLAVSKQSSGTINLTGTSSYTGPTTILSTGSLGASVLTNIGEASSIGKGSATNNAGSLVFSATSGSLAYIGDTSVSIDRLFTMSGGGQLASSSSTNAALVMKNTAAIPFGTTGAQTLFLGGTSTGDNQFFPKLSNNGAAALTLTKAGNGVWVLAGQANDYTGPTNIGSASTSSGGGILRIVGTSLPTNSPVNFNSNTTLTAGVLELSGNFTRPLAATAVAGASTVSWQSGTSIGGGFAASDAKLTVAIGGLAAPTALTWGSGGFMMGGGSLLLNSYSALSEVEFRNAINLGSTARNIAVDDNTSTFTDYATISGVISGSAGLTKSGAGTLQLLGANSYGGTTTVSGGTLVVSSLGDSTVAGSTSSLGTASSALTSALKLGNASTTGASLIYIGAGESSDRIIQLNATTGNTLIYAEGSGPLILKNLQNSATVTGAKTLFLRGASPFANEVTSNLTDDSGAGKLSVTHDSPSTWILSGTNNFTGTFTNSAGALGIGSDLALGTAPHTLSNVGTYFAANANHTLVNDLTLQAGGNAMFTGDYSLTLTGALTDASTSSFATITNNIAAGSSLFLNGPITHTSTSTASVLQLAGSGDTVINGLISQKTATYGLNMIGSGSVTINTAVTYTGTTTVGNGTLKYGVNQATPSTGTLTVGNFAGSNATVDLNGFSATFAGITFNGSSANATSKATVKTGAGTLTLGGTVTYTATNNPLGATLAGNVTLPATRTFSIGDSSNADVDLDVQAVLTGTSGVGITKTGAGLLRLSSVQAYTGATTINNGTLQYGVSNAIDTASSIALISTVAGQTTTLDLNGFNATRSSLTFGGTGSTSTSTTNVTTGTGTLTLGGNVTYSSSGAPLGSTLSGKLDLGGATRTFTIGDSANAPVDLTVDAAIATGDGVGLIKTGAGTMTLTQGLTLTGTGTVQVTGGGTLNLGGLSNTIASDFQIGYNSAGNLNYNVDGGTLTVGSGSANSVDLGGSGTGSGGGTIDLSGSKKFTANVGAFRVGSLTTGTSPALGSAVSVKLADNNDITATTGFLVGDNASSTSGVSFAASVQFGKGMNNVTTPAFTIGGRKGSPDTSAGAVGTIATGGTLTLNNGVGTTDLFVGNSSQGTGTKSLSTLDLTGGTFIATLGTVKLAVKAASGGSTGSSTATLGIGSSPNNKITASSVTVATNSGGSSGTTNDANGTLSFGGGTFNVTGDVSLALQSGPGTAEGQLNLTGGVFTIGGNLTTTNGLTSTSTLTLAGGTLDLTNGNINVDVFNAQSGKLQNVAQLQGGDGATVVPLLKTTAETLVLAETNGYTGSTEVNEGTIVVSGTIVASAAIDIAGGAALLLDGTSSNRLKDTAPVTLTGGRFGFNSDATTQAGLSETIGTLTLAASSTLDFGAKGANTLSLTGPASVGDFTLSIFNWSGTVYNGTELSISGDPNQDHLLFTSASGTGLTAAQIAGIRIYSDDGHTYLGYGYQVMNGTTPEIVAAIPEPSTLALLAGPVLLALSRRRRK